MGEQVAAGSKENKRQSLFQIERTSAENRNKRAEVNPYQQGSAVPITGFLPVIRGFKGLSFLMTDKSSVRRCTLKISHRKDD